MDPDPDSDPVPPAGPQTRRSGIAVEIGRRDPRWPRSGLALLRRAAVRTMEIAAPGVAAEIGVLLDRDAEVRRLNRDWRGRDKPTNVLSFPLHEPRPGAPVLGDIVLAFETVAREADARGVALTHHGAHLVIHGVLHIVGHHHDTDAAADAMEGLESRILADLAIEDPYSEAPEAACLEEAE